MKNFPRIAAIIFISSIYFFGAALNPTYAATFYVNSKGDSNDAAPGDADCRDTTGNCTLRAAIEESNTLAGDDFIYFNAALAGQTITLDATLTDIDIVNNVTIIGLGANNLAVSGGNAVRVFNITSGTVVLSDFTIRDGSTSGGGGGIFNSGALTLENMAVSNNTTIDNSGGGIYCVSGSFAMVGSTVSNNNAVRHGGGIYLNSVPSVNITNSSIMNNNIAGNTTSVLGVGGGGIYFTSGGNATLSDVNITDNHADNSGGDAAGGGIFADINDVAIINCTIARNTTKTYGGGVHFFYGTHRISGTTISGNTATASFGGGVLTDNAMLTIVNSTLSGNFAASSGGLYNTNNVETNSTILRNVTIAENRATKNNGGGIGNGGGTVSLANTIVANNTAAFGNPDIAGDINSLGNNLVRDRTGSAGYVTSDLPDGTNPLLDVLANNGGLTQTQALLAGSPAINAGNNAQALDSDNATPLTTDQRGAVFARIVNSLVDIGAFEVQAAPTAATIGVSGRVLTQSGRGISGITINLMDSNGAIRTAQTTNFGYYQFSNVIAGETYIITARGKHYSFNQSTRVMSINDELEDINFIGSISK